MEDWEPSTFENELIYSYWLVNKSLIFLEVPIGGTGGRGDWPKGSKIRRIDAIRLPGVSIVEEGILTSSKYSSEEFYTLTKDKDIELIEVKRNLNRLVLGQVVAGTDMLLRQYQPRSVTPIILCVKGDPAMEWVCDKRGITVEIIEPFNN